MITLLSYNTLNIFEEVYTCVQVHTRGSSGANLGKPIYTFLCTYVVYKEKLSTMQSAGILFPYTANTNVFVTCASLFAMKLDRVYGPLVNVDIGCLFY